MATVEQQLQQLAAARALIARADALEVKPVTATKAVVPTPAEQIAALQAENERLRAAAARSITISCKVGGKGGLSVYGFGVFPVTLYKSQWIRLLAASEQITSFITANDAVLVDKPAK